MNLQLYHLCFSVDHDEAEASAAFQARYGAPPEYIIEAAGLLWVGPVPA